jgi:hypothetical protein
MRALTRRVLLRAAAPAASDVAAVLRCYARDVDAAVLFASALNICAVMPQHPCTMALMAARVTRRYFQRRMFDMLPRTALMRCRSAATSACRRCRNACRHDALICRVDRCRSFRFMMLVRP